MTLPLPLKSYDTDNISTKNGKVYLIEEFTNKHTNKTRQIMKPKKHLKIYLIFQSFKIQIIINFKMIINKLSRWNIYKQENNHMHYSILVLHWKSCNFTFLHWMQILEMISLNLLLYINIWYTNQMLTLADWLPFWTFISSALNYPICWKTCTLYINLDYSKIAEKWYCKS